MNVLMSGQDVPSSCICHVSKHGMMPVAAWLCWATNSDPWGPNLSCKNQFTLPLPPPIAILCLRVVAFVDTSSALIGAEEGLQLLSRKRCSSSTIPVRKALQFWQACTQTGGSVHRPYSLR